MGNFTVGLMQGIMEELELVWQCMSLHSRSDIVSQTCEDSDVGA